MGYRYIQVGLTTTLRSPLAQRDPSETLGDANLESQLRSTSPGMAVGHRFVPGDIWGFGRNQTIRNFLYGFYRDTMEYR